MISIPRVLRSGKFILDHKADESGSKAAACQGVRRPVGLKGRTEALIIGLGALRVGPGDSVMTTPFTFSSAAEAGTLAWPTGEFTGINPPTFNVDPKMLSGPITSRTEAILPADP